VIIAIALPVFAVAAVLPGASGWTAGFLGLLLLGSVLSRSIQAIHALLFFFSTAAAPLVTPLFRAWPYPLLVPLIAYFLIVLLVPSLRRSLLWMRTGRLDKEVLLFAAAIAVVSGAALYLWYFALSPDLSHHIRHLPDLPDWTYLFAGLGFAVLNAAMEEAAFRGIVMGSTDSAFGPGVLSLLAQAGLFGVMHYLQGFPRGLWGVGMAFLYGVMLGHLRRRSGGMLAPWLAHVCADLVIFAILAGVKAG
jgi:membrane protease YdiL (CAAX protease family)